MTITEAQQDEAALYALGLLDADEAAAFERGTATDGELRTLADELREAAASLARTDTGDATPPTGLRARVLARVANETRAAPAAGKVTIGPWRRWVPWSVAAALAVCCGMLTWKYFALDHDVRMARDAASLAGAAQQAAPPDALRQVSFCPLDPVPAAPQTEPQVAVLWDAARRRGRLRVTKLSRPADGKDYQLWTVEAGRKDPVNAGVVKVGAGDAAEAEFQPAGDDGKAEVVAFALSVERAGGAPKNEGPILFLGKLQP